MFKISKVYTTIGRILRIFNRDTKSTKQPKTGSNWAPTQISKHWIKFQLKPTIFLTRVSILRRGTNSCNSALDF